MRHVTRHCILTYCSLLHLLNRLLLFLAKSTLHTSLLRSPVRVLIVVYASFLLLHILSCLWSLVLFVRAFPLENLDLSSNPYWLNAGHGRVYALPVRLLSFCEQVVDAHAVHIVVCHQLVLLVCRDPRSLDSRSASLGSAVEAVL